MATIINGITFPGPSKSIAPESIEALSKRRFLVVQERKGKTYFLTGFNDYSVARKAVAHRQKTGVKGVRLVANG